MGRRGNTQAGKAYGVHGEDPHSWTKGYQQELKHEGLIASGGFSEVHKMRNLRTGKVLARKLIRVFGQVLPADIENEARILSELGTSRCPYVVEVLQHGWLEDGRTFYFIDMEFCPETLDERIRKTKLCACLSPSISTSTPLAPEDCRCRPHWESITAILLDVVSGLIYIHEKGIVHRDLKPLNVLFSLSQGRWQLCDFGISAAATSKRAIATNSGRGTGGYRAPEVLDAGVYNNKSDQFALGCIVFELIFGAKLFRNEDWRVHIFSQNPEIVLSNLWPVQQSSEILKTFRQLVVSLIAIDPSSRPSARETKVTLESIIVPEDEGPMGHASTNSAIVPTDSLNQPPDDDRGGVRYDDRGSTGDDGAAKSGNGGTGDDGAAKSGEGTAGSDGDAVGYWS